MSMVYVQSKDGKPLMPTTRCGHVRILLKEKRARVVERVPFTIQLLYDAPDIVQPLYLGIDPGRTNIGISVVTEAGEGVMLAQMTTRNKDITKLMAERKSYRMAHRRLKRRKKRQRRAKAAGTIVAGGQVARLLPGCEKPVVCKEIRNKKSRFNNRKRSEHWLTPTARHLLDTHLNLVKKLSKFLPISHVVLEINRFAFMAMEDPNIKRWEYQRGPLYQQGSVEEAVYAQQDGHCIFCGAPIEHYHHVVPRSKGGSEVLTNRAGLCEKHHRLVHTEAEWEDKLAQKKAGLNKKYHALSVLNQIIPYLVEELGTMFPGKAFATTGKDTASFRLEHGIPKDHYLDAFCIACSVLNEDKFTTPTEIPYQINQYRRHDRQACQQVNIARKYYNADGNLVATNRHKAMEQKSDSLEEYRAKFGNGAACHLLVKEHKPTYKDMARVKPGSTLQHNSKIFIMRGSSGRHKGKPNYYFSSSGERLQASKCFVLRNNPGIAFVS